MMRRMKETVKNVLLTKRQGISKIIVVFGLCALGLALVEMMEIPLGTFVTTTITNITTKCGQILGS